MIEFDHVILTVTDLDEAAARLLADHGLASAPGGRHTGHGTGNRIIPLGSSYVELMAVLDEAEARMSPIGRWVLDARAGLRHGRALCLRTDDITAEPAALAGEPMSMSRLRPDGVELSWAMTGLDAMVANGEPFFIEWHVAPADHPASAAAAHSVRPIGISWVELGSTRPAGTDLLDIRRIDGIAGVGRVGVATAEGEIIV